MSTATRFDGSSRSTSISSVLAKTLTIHNELGGRIAVILVPETLGF